MKFSFNPSFPLSSKPFKGVGLFLFFIFSCSPETPKEVSGTQKPDSVASETIQSTSARPVHWSYSGEVAPENWGKLSPVYALCTEGKHQSPVNIINSSVKSGTNWKFNYTSSSLRIAHNEHMEDIVDNGHTIQVTVDEGSTFEINGKIYSLKQFHFHTPSEHSIDGKHFPMEVHFVHQNDSGQFAVVSILVKEGKENDNIAKIIAHLPDKKGEMKHLQDIHIALQFHLPKINEAYHYKGSLTTPPCSEGVEWLVFRKPIEASKAQIEAFSSRIGNNNRPLQTLETRTITLDALSGQTQE